MLQQADRRLQAEVNEAHSRAHAVQSQLKSQLNASHEAEAAAAADLAHAQSELQEARLHIDSLNKQLPEVMMVGMP